MLPLRPRESGEEDEEKEGGQMTTPDNGHTPSTTTANTTTTIRHRAITHPVPVNSNTARVRGVTSLLPQRSDARATRPPGSSRFGSYPPSPHRRGAHALLRMSANPAREAEENIILRHCDRVSDVDDVNSVRSSRRGSGSQEMAHVSRDDDGHIPGGGSMEKMDSSLAADDGMHDLRQRLHEIRQLAISTEEKAMRMHALMTQDYTTRHAGDASPMSLSGDAKSLNDEATALDVGAAALPINPANPYNIRDGDLEPTWSPLPHIPAQGEDPEDIANQEYPIVMGCMHYKRNVKVQCFDCHRWFPCRYCHDQSHDLPFSHSLRRKMTRNMLCMLCQTPQPAAESCVNCGEYAAWYFCNKCKLWDNDSNKRIYHCDDCGICRLGEGLGKDYVHCKKCDVCISIATSAAHTCVENATKGPCPLCLDEMFASRAKVVSLRCGHYMHGECYRDLMHVTYKCPVCSKSAVNMELQWRKLDDDIRAQPMPEDDEDLEGLLPHLEDTSISTAEGDAAPSTNTHHSSQQPRRPRKVWISCNDCTNRCWTAFHWLGLKCQHCDSYNTTQIPPTTGHVESEAERLLRQQQTAAQQQTELTGTEVLRAAGIGANEADSPVDSALDGIPSSPASYLAVPGSPGSPGSTTSSRGSNSGGLPSPRRYFVRDEEPRRASFTPMTLPMTLPHLPDLPRLPRMPNLPNMPQMPNMPQIPHLPHLRNLPNMPYMPQMPNMPDFSGRFGRGMPDFALPEFALPEFFAAQTFALPEGLGRFSPGWMWESWVGRGLSPMRGYWQGEAEGRGGGVRGGGVRGARGRGRVRRKSGLSVRSDPTADATAGKSGWGAEGEAVDEDFEGEGGDDEVALADDEESSGSDEESEEESEEEDEAEMGEEDDGDPMELFGHR